MSYVSRLKATLNSRLPKHKALVARVNEELIAMKAANLVPHQPSTMGNLSVQYQNGLFIGDQLMPIVTVSKKSDIYYVYDKRSRLSGPDDRIGNRATPNEINENRTTATFSTKDYALTNYVDNETLRNQDAPLDEMVDLVQAINDVIALKREQRQAAILTTAGNYGLNTAALAGIDQFDNAGNLSIIQKMQAMTEALWTGTNATKKIAFCSLEVWNAIARNPNIRGLFNYVQAGLATRQQVANFFGWDDILVSDARQDTANEGQTAPYGRIWGKVFGLVRVAAGPTIRSAQFGSTFRFAGDPVTDSWYNAGIGKSGGWYARVGLSEDYKVVASDTGFLYTAAIA